MSKVETLKEKYKKLGPGTVSFFIEADETPTKKYLEYMLKTWAKRNYDEISVTKKNLVDATVKFEELLPYIKDKDIYSSKYNKLSNLISIIEEAEDLREEKFFEREKHVIVIRETDAYLLISPITHKGSVKYGRETKWCTSSKDSDTQFKNYSKGTLVYLIDKTGKRSKSYQKVALYCSSTFSIGESYNVFNATDNQIYINYLIKNGWTEDEVFEIDIYFRDFARQNKKIKESISKVNTVITFMKNFDNKCFSENLQVLLGMNMIDTKKLQSTINEFNEKMSKLIDN